jgi:acyl-CoA synthetase (AMP-forming)/AMP-acid ligase II/alkylation response protein AidB-like acyl-CoA dehydrogenase/acyl carrier protein
MGPILQPDKTATGYAPTTLVDLLRYRVDVQAGAQACLYLADGEEQKGELTFGELDRQARALAARLQGLGATGECAVLLYPQGLEFLSAFFGCLYAGVVAVPLPVPRVNASAHHFLEIVRDVNARIVLTNTTSLGRLRRLNIAELDTLVCLTTEDTHPDLARAWRQPSVQADSIAYLQYTSGSTSARKGVALSHRNVLANVQAIAERFRHHEASVCVNWLPHIHDLGLVSGIIQPLYFGHRNILMSPTAFVQQPVRWLDAISRFRGTYSNSPNFGYDLCVRRTTADERARLDLSSWQVALNGAEPVRHQTIEEFTTMFEPCGFRRETMYPAYGLAEATLVVSGGLRDARPISMTVDAAALERDRVVESAASSGVRTLVGCGHALQDTTIAIVDPATGERRRPLEIGEIWVSGPAVARYWQRDEDNAHTFQARLPDDSRRYLRTGDLGFLRDDELFITGRLKDLIIVRGFNHYPQDIEWTIEQSHAAFRPGCGAAFAVDADGVEQVVAVFEVERDYLRTLDGEELERIARAAVAEQHDLHLHTLVLLKTGTVPRTSSGKIQRGQCRRDFLNDELAVVWRANAASAAASEAPGAAAATEVARVANGAAARTASDTCAWLREYANDCINSRLMDERRSVAPHVILDFGNRGILGLTVPSGYGGAGFSTREALTVIEQLGAIDQTLAMMTVVHNVLGIGPILHHGDSALKSRWLPPLASGRELVAFALTEPGAGSNPLAIASTAAPEGTGAWRLHGQKSWSGTAGWASVINVFAQTLDPDGHAAGISGFAVARSTPGVRVGAEALTLGMRAMVQNTIHLDGARVTRAQCLGEVGKGMKVAQDAMMQGRLAIGAACVGGMKRCLQLLVRYADRRTISTGLLLDNPVLLERVAGWTMALAALETVVSEVAQRLDRGEPVPAEAYAVCKIAGAEWFWRAADDLVQFLGGRGYIETNLAAQLLRDARVTRILEGPSEALGMYLGSRVVSDGASLHQFIAQTLRAPDVATRLSTAAEQVHAECVTRERFRGPLDARRWAYALIGQLACDAVLTAAVSRARNPHRSYAEARFEAAVAAALAHSQRDDLPLTAATLRSLVVDHTAAIGDLEQSLPGEDQSLDPYLTRVGPSSATPPTRPAVETTAPAAGSSVVRPAPRAIVPAAEIEAFIVGWVAKELKLRPGSVDPTRSVFDCGLDSVNTVLLCAQLEDWLRVEVSPEVVYDVPVVREFAALVARRQDAARS